jgi:hypothetical protein
MFSLEIVKQVKYIYFFYFFNHVSASYRTTSELTNGRNVWIVKSGNIYFDSYFS